MKYYYEESEKTNYGEISVHPLFDKLVSYLDKHKNERIILRQLHEEFPEKDFEKFLDKLISFGLVIRENRQYRLGFPIFEKIDEADLSETVNQLAAEVQKIPLENQPAYLGEIIWCRLFPKQEYFYGVRHEEKFYTKSTAGNQAIQFVSITKGEESLVTLPNYFSLIRQKKTLPHSFNTLYQMIGDVNEVYFFNQIEMILEKMEAGRLRTRRRNIFLESLVETGVVAESLLQFNWPILTTEKLKDFDCSETPVVNSTDEMVEERVYKSSIVFKSLLKNSGVLDIVYVKK